MGGSGIPGTKFSLPEIRGIFQMFQSRLKGCVCRAGMATMLIGGEFRMGGGAGFDFKQSDFDFRQVCLDFPNWRC